MAAATLTSAASGLDSVNGYARVGSALGFAFGTLAGEPVAGQVVDAFITGTYAGSPFNLFALVGDTTALGLTQIWVDGVPWTLSGATYYSSPPRTEYVVSGFGAGFSPGNSYAVSDTAPGLTITSPNAASNNLGATLAHSLTANEAVTWSIVGGANQALFEINGTTLRWVGNGVSASAGAKVVTVRATSTTSGLTADQNITVTVIVPYAGPTFGAVGTAVGSAAATIISVTSVRGVGRRMFIPVMTANQAIGTPSGWQAFIPDSGTPQRGTAGAAGGVRLTLWWKDSDGTESTVTVADSGDIQYGVPFSVVPSAGSTISFDASIAGNAASTSGAISGTTTGADNCFVVGLIATDRDATGATWTSTGYGNLANGSKRFDNGTSTGTGGGIAIFTGEKTLAGATGDITATQAGNVANAFMMVALKNVAAPPSRDLPRSHFWL